MRGGGVVLGFVLIKHLKGANLFMAKSAAATLSLADRHFLAEVAARVTKMPVNSREFVALSQHPSSVVPHQSRGSPVNGECSTVGKPHASTYSSL